MPRKKSETFPVEYSTGKRRRRAAAQGRRILVEAYKNARMRVKERKKETFGEREKKKKERNTSGEEESVDLAVLREIVGFPLAASRSYLRAE